MKNKFYTCVWSEYGREVFGVEEGDNPFFSVDPELHGVMVNVSKNKRGRRKMRQAEMFPFFETYEEAEAYRDMNEHWKTIEIEIIFTP